MEANDCCAICLSSLEGGSCQRLVCGHCFHAECISELRRHGVLSLCPLCRNADPQVRSLQEMFEEAVWLFVRHQRTAAESAAGDIEVEVIIGEVEVACRCRELLLEVLNVDRDHAGAAVVLGGMYLHGPGGAADATKARSLYERADFCGNLGGTVGLACMCEGGIGGIQDLERARELYAKADSGRNLDGTLGLAHMCWRGLGGNKSEKQARELFEKAHNGDDLDGSVGLAKMCQAGIGGEKAEARARGLFRKAHLGGHIDGSIGLARMRKVGAGGKVRDGLARQMFAKAHAAGSITAAVEYAIMLLSGEGGERDEFKARELLEMASARGQGRATIHLARMVAQGIGGPRDQERAAELDAIVVRKGCSADLSSSSRGIKRLPMQTASSYALYDSVQGPFRPKLKIGRVQASPCLAFYLARLKKRSFLARAVRVIPPNMFMNLLVLTVAIGIPALARCI